jgi:hypothetical protein
MKIGTTLLLLLVASTASAQVDERLFAHYVHSVVECCPGRRVVVFYSGAEPFVFGKYLEGFELDQGVTMVSLDDPSKNLRAAIKPHVTSRTVAVAYDLGPDATRILAYLADESGAITISTTEEDVYATSFSFDSVLPDRFKSPKPLAGCDLEKCGLTFHSDKVGPNTLARRAIKTFLSAHRKLEPLRKERQGITRAESALLLKDTRKRTSLLEVARLLQDALRHVPEEKRLDFLKHVSKDRILNGEWHDVYAPHYTLGEVFAYFANCEAAELEWQASSKELRRIAPAVLKDLEKLRKQNCS